jgi:methyl-accepting chemotaxis protein
MADEDDLAEGERAMTMGVKLVARNGVISDEFLAMTDADKFSALAYAIDGMRDDVDAVSDDKASQESLDDIERRVETLEEFESRDIEETVERLDNELADVRETADEAADDAENAKEAIDDLAERTAESVAFANEMKALTFVGRLRWLLTGRTK